MPLTVELALLPSGFQFQLVLLHSHGKELMINTVAQEVLGCNRSLGGSGAHMRKDLGVAEKA